MYAHLCIHSTFPNSLMSFQSSFYSDTFTETLPKNSFPFVRFSSNVGSISWKANCHQNRIQFQKTLCRNQLNENHTSRWRIYAVHHCQSNKHIQTADHVNSCLVRQPFSAYLWRRNVFAFGVHLLMGMTGSFAFAVNERALSSYDEKRLLEQNKRIQKANGAPSDFPNFIREGACL
eukprot:TRINITY_DN20446_c0_g1_i1.p1 TRINITY_DN20446_c0_g1~~TRINITY_DN20446_c0_g1_i1.p1  ORF type:complete len:176 (+),score=5.96 TRINITY_DN20446_c0_g1_i1:77-604(+)